MNFMPALFRLSFVEVETPSTPVSPCASSSILAPSAVAAPIKCSGGARGRRKAHKQSRTLRSRRRLHGRALLRGRKQRHHHLLFLCRRADVGIPKVELSVLRFDGFLDLHGPNPVQSRPANMVMHGVVMQHLVGVPLVTMSKCVSDHVRPVERHTSRRKRFCTVDRCEI